MAPKKSKTTNASLKKTGTMVATAAVRKSFFQSFSFLIDII
jgi:hypothetical protein